MPAVYGVDTRPNSLFQQSLQNAAQQNMQLVQMYQQERMQKRALAAQMTSQLTGEMFNIAGQQIRQAGAIDLQNRAHQNARDMLGEQFAKEVDVYNLKTINETPDLIAENAAKAGESIPAYTQRRRAEAEKQAEEARKQQWLLEHGMEEVDSPEAARNIANIGARRNEVMENEGGLYSPAEQEKILADLAAQEKQWIGLKVTRPKPPSFDEQHVAKYTDPVTGTQKVARFNGTRWEFEDEKSVQEVELNKAKVAAETRQAENWNLFHTNRAEYDKKNALPGGGVLLPDGKTYTPKDETSKSDAALAEAAAKAVEEAKNYGKELSVVDALKTRRDAMNAVEQDRRNRAAYDEAPQELKARAMAIARHNRAIGIADKQLAENKAKPDVASWKTPPRYATADEIKATAAGFGDIEMETDAGAIVKQLQAGSDPNALLLQREYGSFDRSGQSAAPPVVAPAPSTRPVNNGMVGMSGNLGASASGMSPDPLPVTSKTEAGIQAVTQSPAGTKIQTVEKGTGRPVLVEKTSDGRFKVIKYLDGK